MNCSIRWRFLDPTSSDKGTGLAGLFTILSGYLLLLTPIGGLVGVVMLLVALLLAIVLLIVFAIIMYKLIMRYIIFLLLTIFAPLFFLFGSIPGAEGLILGWFKRAAAALVAIPATALTIKLAFAISFSGFGQIDIPPLMFGPVEKVFGWFFAAPIIGFGLLFFATKVPDIVDELFGVKEMGFRKGVGPGIIAAPVALPAKAMQPLSRAPQAINALHTMGGNLAGRGGFMGSVGRGLQKVTTPVHSVTADHASKVAKTHPDDTEAQQTLDRSFRHEPGGETDKPT